MNGFAYYNPNPDGDFMNDCVIRAYAFFFGVSWKKAFLDAMQFCAERGLVRFNFPSVFNKYLESKGYKRHRTPRRGMTVGQFRDEFAVEGKCYIVSCPRHFTVVFQKDIVDIADCSKLRVIAYWESESLASGYRYPKQQ